MAELTIDETLNEIRVLDKGKELVIKAKKIFSARLFNDNFVWVLTDANSSDEKRTLYNIDGEIIYEFWRCQRKAIFMGRELKTDIQIGVVAYYPPKKQLLICGSYQEGNGHKSNGTCIYIYNDTHKLLKVFDEPYVWENTQYKIVGVGCDEANRVELLMREIGGEYWTWRMALDMDTYKLTKISYDPR